MATFSHSSTINFPRDTVFAWHNRPGALTRLNPHWAGSVAQEAASLEPGERATLAAAIPGTRGLITQKCVSEQTDLSAHSFSDRMIKGPFRTWNHTHHFDERGQQTTVHDHVEYEVLPRFPLNKLANRYLEKMMAERNRRLEADLAFHARYDSKPLTVVIAGASGMVGTQVSALLGGGGHTVRHLVRHTPKGNHEFQWSPDQGQIDESVFDGADAVIHLGGATISTRFTEENKKKILDSRVKSTTLLAETLAQRVHDGGPQTFICASAIGYYGADRGGELLREDSGAGSDFLANVCLQWESACDAARAAGVRVVNVRTGLVQSVLGGMLRVQLPLFLTGTGGAVGTGTQMQSWISLDDIAGIYVHALLTDSLEGPVNAVAPHPVTAHELTATVGKVLRRPAALPIPPFAPALVLKKQGAKELTLADQNVSCSKLEASGYRFFETDLLTAMRHELG